MPDQPHSPLPPSARDTSASGRGGWLELRVDCPQGFGELVADCLRSGDEVAVWVSGPAEPPPAPGLEAVRAYLPAGPAQAQQLNAAGTRIESLARRSGLEELAALRLEWRAIPASDWAQAWRKSWRPFRVGRLCVVPPWRTEPLRESDIPLRLEPGGVFGTGRHASTRTCLGELQSLPLAGARLIDAGTGTGILAVAALLLGAAHVLAFDTDAGSAPHALALARDNGLSGDRVRFVTGGFEQLEGATGPVDGVMANIYHDVLQSQAGPLSECLRPGGWFLFSGIHRDQRAPTLAAVRAAGLIPERDLCVGKWCTLVGRRP